MIEVEDNFNLGKNEVIDPIEENNISHRSESSRVSI